MDLFFVLSGCLIYGGLIRRDLPLLTFWRRRATRIFPTFLVVLGLYLVMMTILPATAKFQWTDSGALWLVAANVLLLPGLFPVTPMITVAWSLSYEWAFYLFVPLMTKSLRFGGRSAALRVAVLLALAAVLVAAVAAGWTGHSRLLMFPSGMLLFEVLNSGRLRWRIGRGWEALAIVAFGGASAVTALSVTDPEMLPAVARVGLGQHVFLAAAAFSITLCAMERGTWVSRMVAAAPLRLLGRISFSYYLTHGLAMHALAKAITHPGHSVALFAGLLPLVLAATVLFGGTVFLAVEEPLSLPVRSVNRQAARYLELAATHPPM